ncbi:MAG: GAF domain-containing protein [Deltaproteobacteria bacterium]|nr:GAF domain-containing protein [Deltaproteobacteria bacterium]
MDCLVDKFPFRYTLSLEPLFKFIEKSEAEGVRGHPALGADFLAACQNTPALRGDIADPAQLEPHRDMVERLMSLVFPAAYWSSEACGAVVPFVLTPFFYTKPFRDLFMTSQGELAPRANLDKQTLSKGRAVKAYLMILERLYGMKDNLPFPLLYTVRDPDTGLDRHYRLRLDFSFIEIASRGPVKPLTPEELGFVESHLTEPEALKTLLPPENFEIRGFTTLRAVDVTTTEVISALQRDLIDHESIVTQAGFHSLQQHLRTLFKRPDLMAGLEALHEDHVIQFHLDCGPEGICALSESEQVPLSQLEGSVYQRVLDSDEIIRVPDVHNEPGLAAFVDRFDRSGSKSLLIAPLYYQGRCIGTLHLKSPRPCDLGPTDALVLRQLQPLFALALKKALNDLESQVDSVIKENCTAIHPSVEWRFRQAALRHLKGLRLSPDQEFEEIVFPGVYHLYGVCDVRSSSTQHNEAIARDLAQHLELALHVVDTARQTRQMPLLDELAARIGDHTKRLSVGLGTGDEAMILGFLRRELETEFEALGAMSPRVARALQVYEQAMDPHRKTVHRRRRNFEESLAALNQQLAVYLDRENQVMQAIYPHYFERHRTDGVDYLIYLGGSLVEDGRFSRLYLKNLRLWQLVVACGMAWQAEQLKHELSAPLEVAQLVLVHDTPLAIRFRYDEKRFDVETGYDLRHEIIKARLEKAVTKEGQDRLTQPGAIAVVYSQPEEVRESLRHIEYLQSQGYLTRQVDRLELEDLPGVQGLKALRVGVNLQSRGIAARSERMAG